LHRRGDERIRWQQLSIDQLLSASGLWEQTHPCPRRPRRKMARPCNLKTQQRNLPPVLRRAVEPASRQWTNQHLCGGC
jgi:hypothetical protein